MTRTLILDGSIWPEIYRPTDHWSALLAGTPFVSVHLPSGQRPPDATAFTHVIVTGSEASVVEPEPWFEVEAAAIRRAEEVGLPMLGSCFGHQMLARTLSGERHVARAAEPEIGWLPVAIGGTDPLFDGLPNPVWMFASHFDEVRDPPAPWRVIGRSAGCAVHVMRWGDAPIWGIQAHPEIGPEDARMLMNGFAARRPDLAERFRPALEAAPHDDGTAEEIVRRFLSFG